MPSSQHSSWGSKKKASNKDSSKSNNTFAMTRSTNQDASASSSRAPHRVRPAVVIAAGASSSSGKGNFGLSGDPIASGWQTSDARPPAKMASSTPGTAPPSAASSSDRGYPGSTHSHPSPRTIPTTGSHVGVSHSNPGQYSGLPGPQNPGTATPTPYQPNPTPPAPGTDYGYVNTNRSPVFSNTYPANAAYGDPPQFPQHQSQQQNMFGPASLPPQPPFAQPTTMPQPTVPPAPYGQPSATIPQPGVSLPPMGRPPMPASDYQPENTTYWRTIPGNGLPEPNLVEMVFTNDRNNYTGAEGGPAGWTAPKVKCSRYFDAEPSVSEWKTPSVRELTPPKDYECDVSSDEANSRAIIRRERDS